jgi:hypothetical protein
MSNFYSQRPLRLQVGEIIHSHNKSQVRFSAKVAILLTPTSAQTTLNEGRGARKDEYEVAISHGVEWIIDGSARDTIFKFG